MIKKIRILGVAPYKGLATLMKQCALQYPEIEFTAYAGSMEQGLALAKRYSEHYDFIIRPGGHTGRYWNNAIDYQILFFSKFFNKSK